MGLTERSADTVVVGAGTAGCLVAARLAAAGREVLLLEQGPISPPGPEVTALARLPLHDAGRVVAVPERRGRPVVRGRGLGGSAAINGGYFLRADPADSTGWPQWWTPARIADGYAAVEELLAVAPFADDELGDVPRAFERYWAGEPGLIRVRSNARDGRRVTAAAVLPAAGCGAAGGTPRVRRARVDEVLLHRAGTPGARVAGVRAGGEVIGAGEVIVCAGTLGTAALLVRSGLPGDGPRPLREHAERLVRFAPRGEVRAPALLQSVLHADGLEIRCYGDDFARFIPGVAPRGIPIGIADLARPLRGSHDGRIPDLGVADARSRAALRRGVDRVVEMLNSSSFADLVVPGSVTVDPVIGTSQHAYGTLPLGTATDPLGALPGVDGLRVVDGSLLPGPLHAGPHATIAMLAWVIGGALADAPGLR